MVFTLPPDLADFVRRLVVNGDYDSEEAVIVAGLRLLQDRQRHIEELREELRPALEELDRGEGKPLDKEEIKRKGRERLANEC
jgi:putative addiction module CopG family antidote